MSNAKDLAVSDFELRCISCCCRDERKRGTNPGAAIQGRHSLITLGTVAGPPPRAHRAQFSNLLIVNDTLYVVDAGDGVVRRIAKAGFNVRDVGIIFITHHHDDHTAGLGTLMSAAWDNQRTKPINVYGPPRTEDLVKAAVQYFTISAEIRIADGGRTIPIEQLFLGHDVGPGVIYQDANINVTAIENTHFGFHKGPAAGKHKSYSYRFIRRVAQSFSQVIPVRSPRLWNSLEALTCLWRKQIQLSSGCRTCFDPGNGKS